MFFLLLLHNLPVIFLLFFFVMFVLVQIRRNSASPPTSLHTRLRRSASLASSTALPKSSLTFHFKRPGAALITPTSGAPLLSAGREKAIFDALFICDSPTAARLVPSTRLTLLPSSQISVCCSISASQHAHTHLSHVPPSPLPAAGQFHRLKLQQF